MLVSHRFGPERVKRKIGKCGRLDLECRRKENGRHEGVPEAFIIEDAYWFPNGNQIECFTHLMFDEFRAAKKNPEKANTRSEFFTLPDKELQKLKIYFASQFSGIKYDPLKKYTPEDLPGYNEHNEDAEQRIQSSKKQKKQKTSDRVFEEMSRDDSSIEEIIVEDASLEELVVPAIQDPVEEQVQSIVDAVQDLSISELTEIDKTQKKRIRCCGKKQKVDEDNCLNLPDGTEIVTTRLGVEMRVFYAKNAFYECGTSNHWTDGNAVAREHVKRIGGRSYGGYNWTEGFKYVDPVTKTLLKIKEKVNYL